MLKVSLNCSLELGGKTSNSFPKEGGIKHKVAFLKKSLNYIKVIIKK